MTRPAPGGNADHGWQAGPIQSTVYAPERHRLHERLRPDSQRTASSSNTASARSSTTTCARKTSTGVGAASRAGRTASHALPDPAAIRTLPARAQRLPAHRARQVDLLNFGLARDYGGRCHYSTTPTGEGRAKYDSIVDAVRWLGFDWRDSRDNLYYASDYFDHFTGWPSGSSSPATPMSTRRPPSRCAKCAALTSRAFPVPQSHPRRTCACFMRCATASTPKARVLRARSTCARPT